MAGFKYESGQNVPDLGWLSMVDGRVQNISVVQKFGGNSAVGTSFVPVTAGGVYRTPQVSGATTLRIKAGGNANDTAAGSGARAVTLVGLDATGAEISETVATAGTAASTATSSSFLRLFRAFVSSSGTYATASAGSHAGSITIENGAGGTDWATINATDFARSQTEIGAYTVPLGKRAYISTIRISTDAAKSTDVVFFQRQNILQTSAPYTAMRQVVETVGLAGEFRIQPKTPFGPYPALTDLGCMAKVSTATGAVEVDFEVILIG